jgi:hypothetical protein
VADWPTSAGELARTSGVGVSATTIRADGGKTTGPPPADGDPPAGGAADAAARAAMASGLLTRSGFGLVSAENDARGTLSSDAPPGSLGVSATGF